MAEALNAVQTLWVVGSGLVVVLVGYIMARTLLEVGKARLEFVKTLGDTAEALRAEIAELRLEVRELKATHEAERNHRAE